MKLRATLSATLLLIASLALAQTPPSPEVTFNDGFQAYGTQANPPGWVDTSVGQPKPEAAGLYKTWPDPFDKKNPNVVYGTKQASGNPDGNNPRIGTFSTLSTKTFDSRGRFEYRGRFIRTNEDSRIGVTVLSSYPQTDSYYLIGLWSQPTGALTMQLFGFGAGTLTGTRDSNVSIAPNTWYRFLVQVDDANGQTNIRARFWPEGSNEPATFSIDAADAAAARLTRGRIGLWAAVKGEAYWDDLSAKSPVDFTAPLISILESGTPLVDGTIFKRDAVPEIRVSDDLSSINVTATLNGQPYTSLTPVTAERWHILVVRAADSAGNASETEVKFLVDKTPPVVAVLESGVAFPEGKFFNRDVVATASVTDASNTLVTATIDGQAYVPGTPYGVEGAHTLTVTAVDEAGWTTTVGPLPFTIDKTAPVITFTSHQNGAVLTAAQIVAIGGADDSVALTVNNTPATLDAAAKTFTSPLALLEGDNTLVAVGTDRAGNVGQATLTLVLDTRAPELTLTAPAADACLDAATLTVSGTVSEARLASVTVNGVAATVTGSSWTASIPATEGKLLLTVEARDTTGHVASRSRSVIVDRTAPVLDVTSGGAPFTATLTNRAVSLFVRATDTDTNVVLTSTLDGAAYTSGSTIGGEGAHTLVVKATDCAGHVTEQTFEFTIDLTPPTIRDFQPANGGTVGTMPSAIRAKTDTDVPTVTLDTTSLSATPGADGSFTIDGVAFAEGTNRFTLVATDRAGNTASVPYSVVVRTAAPAVEIRESGLPIVNGTLYNRAVTPMLRAIPDATISATLNGAPYTSGTTISNDGEYRIVASATDDLGHTGTAEATFSIDRTSPVVTIATPAHNAIIRSDRVEVRGTVTGAIVATINGAPLALGDGGVFVVELPLDYGVNPIFVTARDAAGNGGRADITVTRDDAGAGIILTYPPDHAITNRPSTDVVGRLLTAGRATTVTVGTRSVAVDPTGAFRVTGYALVEGENAITATATAENGITTSATTHVTADFTPPSLTILESNAPLADNARFATQAVVSLAASDSGGGPVTTELTVDGTAAASLPSTITAVGGHSVVAVARDRAGNQSRAERMLFIGAATGSADCRLEGFDPSNNAVVLANSTTLVGRSGGAIGVKVNGVPAIVADGSFSANVELPNEGPNTVTVNCTDANGTATGTPATLVLQRVTGDPSISITTPAENFVTSQETIAVSGTVGSGVTSADVNGVAATITGSTFTVNAVRLSDGLNVLVAHGRNAAGRTATASRRGIYEKDAPTVSISAPANNTTTGANRIVVSGTYTNVDPTSLVVTNLAGNQATAAQFERSSDTTGTYSAEVPLSSGDQTLRVSGRDRMNREATAGVIVKLAAGAPGIAIAAPANHSYFGAGSETFTVSGTFGAASGSTVEVNGTPATIDGSSYTASVKFGTPAGLATPVVARVTQPDGASAVAMVFITQLVDAPRVVESFPADDAFEVDAGALLLVLFSQPMERDSAVAAFRLEDANGAPVSGTLFLDKDVLTFAPATLLARGGRYTMRVTTAAKNLAGTPLVAAYTSTFTVASSAPSTPPSIDPVGSAVCGQTLTVNGTAAPGARVRLESGALVLTASADTSGRFTFTYPLSGQSGFTLVRVRVVGSDGSLSPAAELTVRADCSGPQVLNASFDRVANRLAISFSEAIDGSTVDGAIALVLTDGTSIASTSSTSQNVVTVTPASDLTQKTFTLTVGTQVEDTTGNKLVAPYTQEFALSGGQPEAGDGSGFISGEVYDATTGRPLPNATIAVDVASPAPVTTTTDARGRYLARLPEGAHTISAAHAGYTTVWREIIVPAGAGVIPIDIRLTNRGAAVTSTGAALALTSGGDTAVTRRVDLAAPAGSLVSGAKLSLTSIGAQALTGLLPLGWSPIASAEVHLEGAPALNAATLTFHTPPGVVAAATQNLTAVRYDSARDEWRVLEASVNVAADGKASFAIPGPAAYALVYSDKAPGLTPPPLPVAGDVLQGVPAAPVDAPQLVGRDFSLDPPIVLPTGRTVATLRIEGAGLAKFPSGTAVQAYIDEELRLADGSRLLDPPFATDLLLYRNLAGDLGIADFHLAPSAKAAQVILDVGFDHIRILPYPGRLDRGTLIGPEGGRVPADDKVAIDIPTGSVPEPLRATAMSLSATELNAVGTVAGFRVVGGFNLTLQRATQPAPQDLDNDGQPDAVVPPELFVPANATFSVDAAKLPAPTAQVILAELLDDTPYGRMVRLAVPMMAVEQSSTPVIRYTTKAIDRSILPVDGLVREGRYVVLAAEAPIAFATGTVRMRDVTGRLLADARVTAAPLGVTDLTRGNGIYNVPVPARPAAPFTLVPRFTSTGDGAPYTHNAQVDPDSISRVDLTLVPQPPVLGSVVVFKGTPPSQAALTFGTVTRDVSLTTNIRASFTPAIDPASVTDDSISVVDAITGKAVSGKATADGTTGVVWTLTAGERFQPASTYNVVVSSSIRGTNGALLGRSTSFSFATITVFVNSEIHRERIRITIPNEAGISRINGDAGALPAGWQAVATRRVRDFLVRYQGTAAGDGSFAFFVGDDDPRDRVTMGDFIDLQVINTNGALVGIYALTPFVTEDGKGFVAPAGAAVSFTSPDGITVNVPEGAFDTPTVITVNPAQKAEFLDIPELETENEYATSVNIDFEGFANKPLDVEVAVPAGFDVNGKDFILAWKGMSVRGPRLAAVDVMKVVNGKFTTAFDDEAESARVDVLNLKTGTNQTLVGRNFRDYLLRLIRGGRYMVLDIKQPVGGSVGWAVMEGLQANYDLMWDIFWSYYDPYVHVFERGGRAIPVVTGKPFTVYGIDRATGLQAYSRAYDPIPVGEPGEVVTIPSPQQNDGGPYPIFGTPFRAEILDLDVEDLDIRTIRNFNVRLSNDNVTVSPSDDPIPDGMNVQLLNVKQGTATSGTGSLTLGAKLGDRIVLLIEQADVDASHPVSVVLNEPLFLGESDDPDAIDQFLHGQLKLEQAPEPPSGGQPQYTDITPHARFTVDSGDRRINVVLPGALQREAVYRLTLKGTLTDATTEGAGLKLGAGTVPASNGNLTPVGGGTDLPLVFHVRKPEGEVGSFSAADTGILRGMDMHGNVLMVATMEGGLRAFDVSNPAAINGFAPQLAHVGPPNTVYKTQALEIDRHGRVYTTADLNIVGVLLTYRVEDFANGSASIMSAKASTIINWKLGYSSMIGLPSNTILSDRPESIPFRIKNINQDDTQDFKNRELFVAGTGAGETGDYPLDDMKSYNASIPASNPPYGFQRVTIENIDLDMSWSADAVGGGPAEIKNILARSTDRLRVVKNLRSYAVVAHLGYGVGVYDVNAMESNRYTASYGASRLREQKFLGNGIVGRECQLDPPIWAIGENYINTDVEVGGDKNSGDLYVFANHPSKGVLDYRIHLGDESGGASHDASCDLRGPTGLVFRSFPDGNETPRISALKSALGNANMHTMSMSQVHWSVTAEENKRGLRGSYPDMAAQRDYILVASLDYGIIVVETSADPATVGPRFPLDDWHVADVIWIPGGAAGLRVMQDSNTAVVTDKNGRVLLVDLSRIDERWDAEGNWVDGLFPTAAKAIAGTPSDPNERGADDPRIIWKSEPGLTSGSQPPLFDASTGMIYGANMVGRRVKIVSAVDPVVKMKVNLGNGLADVGGVIPLGVAMPDHLQNTIDSNCADKPASCRDNASMGAFRLEVGLPGGMLESLTQSSNELWMAVESERIAGAITEQTPNGFPRAHLRRKRRDGTAENANRVAGNFKFKRVVPDALAGQLKFQRGYNKFISPWIVAIADPRASEQYNWNGATKEKKAEAGCYACERPEFLKNKTEGDGIYELYTNGRYLTVRPELSGAGDDTVFDGTEYAYLGQRKRMYGLFSTIMADTMRPPEVLVAGQNPTAATGLMQETLYLHSGEVQADSLDLKAGGRAALNVAFDRTYRSRTIGGTVFGQGWDAPMLRRLRALPNGDVEFRDGAEMWLFRAKSDGYESPKGLFLKLARTQRGWVMTDQKWRLIEFDDLGRLVSEGDEFVNPQVPGSGNVIRYAYDESGRLRNVVDPVKRVSTIHYWGESGGGAGAYPGLVRQIVDWRDRKVDYEYDPDAGTLTKVQLPEVANSSGGRPLVLYGYAPGGSDYTSMLETRPNLERITDPHEALTGGPARVRFTYGSGGATRDRALTQQWGTGESLSFTYSGSTGATTTDALGQTRQYAMTQQPKDYTSDRAHITSVTEQGVATSSIPFNQLPATVGLAPVGSTADRSFTFDYHPEGLLKTSTLAGVRTRSFTYKDVQPEAPGFVLQSTTTSGPSGTITESLTYQSGANASTFLAAMSANGIAVQAGQAHRNALQVQTSRDSVVTTEKYDVHGLLRSAGDELSTSYAAELDGALHRRSQPTTVSQGEGFATSIQYPGPNQIVQTGPRDTTTTTTYDAWHRPVRMTVAGADMTLDEQYEYDASGRVTKSVRRQDGDDVTTTYAYDALGRPKTITVAKPDSDTITTNTLYDFSARKVTTSRVGGGSMTASLDGLGGLLSTSTSTGTTTITDHYAYDLDRNLVFKTDTQSATAWAYDAQHRRVGEATSDGSRFVSTLDGWGRPTAITDSTGNASTVAYNGGQPASISTRLDGSRTRTTELAHEGGRPTGVSVAGRARITKYDGSGRIVGYEAGEGDATAVATKFEEDILSGHDGDLPRQITRRDKSGSSYQMSLQYNAAAEIISRTIGSLQWQTRFDEAGNLRSSSLPNRPAHTFTYDARGFLERETLPGGAVKSYEHDVRGGLTKFTDPTTQSTGIVTDLVGRPLSRSYPDGTTETIVWDGRRVQSVTDRQGRVQSFGYDHRGLVDQIDGPEGQLDRIEHDDAGRVTRWTTTDAVIEYANYDAEGNPGQTTQKRFRNGTLLDQYTQVHTWNVHGERSTWTMPAYAGLPATRPWTTLVSHHYDAMGNLIGLERTLPGSASPSLMVAGYRAARTPDQRTIITPANVQIIRSYGYDAQTALITRMEVSVAGSVVAGSAVTYDGLQKAKAQLLGVSGGLRSDEWTYDSRSRLQGSSLGRDAGATPQAEQLTAADFREALIRPPAGTPVDLPSVHFTESAKGHKIASVTRNGVIESFEFNAGERAEDGRFTYQYDAKGRLSGVTEKIAAAGRPLRRARYFYAGTNRVVGRVAEYATTATPGAADWKLEDRPAVLAADGLPADSTFVWDPVSDTIVAIFKAGASQNSGIDDNGGLVRQIIGGGRAYDDPIEVATADASAPNGVRRLYPVYDESGARTLQVILDEGGRIVSRSTTGGPYGEDPTVLLGVAVDRVSIRASKDDEGNVETVKVALRATEALAPASIAAGVRLAAVDAAGEIVRTATAAPAAAGDATVEWSLTNEEWTALVDPAAATVDGETRTPVAISIAATDALRGRQWGSGLPVLPAPAWMVASKPVFTSASTPVEVREPLTGVSQWLESIADDGEAESALYEVPTLLALGVPRGTSAADPQSQLVASNFQALPFAEPLSGLIYARARWYDPATGAFLTPDPRGYEDSSNLYAFAAGDPINGADPTGEITEAQMQRFLKLLNKMSRGAKGLLGEKALERMLRRSGRTILSGPLTGAKSVYEGGADIIAYNPRTGLIELWDNKFLTLKDNVSSVPTLTRDTRLQRNIERAEELVRNSNLPDKARILYQLGRGHGYIRYVGGAGLGNSVKGITNRLKEAGIRFGSASFIRRSGPVRKVLKSIAIVGTLVAFSGHVSEVHAAVGEDREFDQMLDELGPECTDCSKVSGWLRNASLLTSIVGIGGEEVLGTLGSAGGAALAGLLGLPSGPGAVLTAAAGAVAGGVIGDQVGRELGTSLMNFLMAEDDVDP